MKKRVLFSLVLSIMMLLSCMPISSSASEACKTVSSTIEYFDDGSYLVTTITEIPSMSKVYEKTGYKTITYKNDNDVTQWTYTLYAKFSYIPNSSSSCTSTWDYYTINSSDWYMTNHSTSYNLNVATGSVTMKRRVAGVNIETINRTITLTCDKYGNLS